MLFDWPESKSHDYNFDPNDPISFQSSDENAGYAVSQVSPGYMGVNLVGFYFAKAKKLFFFHGKDNGLATQCQVFPNVPATAIYETLNAFVRFDFKWLLTITSPRDAHPDLRGESGIERPG